MKKDFLQAKDGKFTVNGEPILLRGWALGSWMNFEHFMVGMPGTNEMIIEAFEEVYGKERAAVFVDKLLQCMVGEEDIVYLKKIGINSIRIPVGYHYLMEDSNPRVFLEAGFEKLNRVVALCEKHEMYVIIDLHSVPGSQNTDWHSDNITGQALFWKYEVFQEQALWLWDELSRRFTGHRWIAGYDVLNEPGYGVTSKQINDFYDRVIHTIRKNDPDHILFLEGTDFGRDFSTLKEFADPQIAYTVHFYPFVLEENVLSQELDDRHRMQLYTDIFDRQLGEVKRFHRPIWCGETGYEILDHQEQFYAMLLCHNIEICEARGISWNIWTYKDARVMGITIPQKQSRWMKLFYEIQKKWSHHDEERISMELTHLIGQKYYSPLSDSLAYDMDFRIRSVLHRVAVEEILKPILQSVPWEEMIMYPDDFLFTHCDHREIVTNRISRFINREEEK